MFFFVVKFQILLTFSSLSRLVQVV